MPRNKMFKHAKVLNFYWATSNNPLTQLTQQTQVEVKWSPFIFPLCKINVDASIFSTQKATVHNTIKVWENVQVVEYGPYTWDDCLNILYVNILHYSIRNRYYNNDND